MLGRRNGLFFFQLTPLLLLLSLLIYDVFLHDPGAPITENTEQIHQQGAPTNPFVAFLTGVGIIGVGVLGALYALARKETAALNSTIELMKRKLSEKEATLAIYSRRLQSEPQERIEEIGKVKEEDASLLNQLASANNELKKLQLELQNEKKQEQDLIANIDHLQSVIAQAGEDKQTLKAELQLKQDEVEFLQGRISLLSSEIKDKEISIENLSLSLDGMELECQKLTSIYNQTKEGLSRANFAAEGLKEEVRETRKELELKKSLEEDLNTRIKLLVKERDEMDKKFHVLHEEYNDFKLASAKREASNAELLSNKEGELNQLKEKLESALNEASDNQSLIAELTSERDSSRTMLEEESNAVKNLRRELQTTQEALEASRLEAAGLLRERNQSERSRDELKSELSSSQDKLTSAQAEISRLTRQLQEARRVIRRPGMPTR